jgi:hypothetical protein
VSGYIYSYARNELGKYRDVKAFILGKVKRLIVPFYFVVFIWVIPINQLFFHNDLKTIVENFVLAKSPSQLWFLWMLFLVFVMVSAIVGLLEKSELFGWGVVFGSYFLYLAVRGAIPNYFQITAALQFVAPFVIGYYMQKKKVNYSGYLGIILFALDIALFIICEFVCPQSTLVFKLIHLGLEFVMHMVGSVMAFVILQAIAARIPWKKSKFFMLLAANSMPMYLFHQQFIYFTLTALNGKVMPEINALINFAVAVAGGMLLSVILMKWKATRALIGEKK